MRQTETAKKREKLAPAGKKKNLADGKNVIGQTDSGYSDRRRKQSGIRPTQRETGRRTNRMMIEWQVGNQIDTSTQKDSKTPSHFPLVMWAFQPTFFSFFSMFFSFFAYQWPPEHRTIDMLDTIRMLLRKCRQLRSTAIFHAYRIKKAFYQFNPI